jgi:phage anti-repressor protein/uncharacterized protein (DUF1778 family)
MDTSLRLDIVSLIEQNPITRFNENYQNKFINKIKEKFTDTEQHLFIGSFYCYLNFSKKEFIIDLENVWKWLGFSRKDACKMVLVKNFKNEEDYTIIKAASAVYGAGGSGLNKETILMNISTFKKLCLKSNTKKADEIHDYFIKLEETLQEVINDESNELKNQLLQTEQALQTQVAQTEIEKQKMRERTILEHFPENTQCVYYGSIQNKTNKGELLIKFGNSNVLNRRIDEHRKTFDNFILINAFKVDNKFQIENEIKQHPILKLLRRTISINGQNQTELLLNNMSYDELDKIIEDIITRVEYTPENYKRILGELEAVKNENEELKKENKILKDILKRDPSVIPSIQQYNSDGTLVVPVSDKIYNYAKNKMRRIRRTSDGLYHIGENAYTVLFGTREEVWNGKAYKTSGELTKDDLTIGTNGDIVSKNKREESLVNGNFKYLKKNQEKNIISEPLNNNQDQNTEL